MIDDHNRCEWVNVSAGPAHKTVVCVCLVWILHLCLCLIFIRVFCGSLLKTVPVTAVICCISGGDSKHSLSMFEWCFSIAAYRCVSRCC